MFEVVKAVGDQHTGKTQNTNSGKKILKAYSFFLSNITIVGPEISQEWVKNTNSDKKYS